MAGLAADAGGLLWELAAMHDTGEAATDMLAKSEQLQVGRLVSNSSMAESAMSQCFEILRRTCG